MRIENILSDEAVTRELGQRLAALRLARQVTQAQLAEKAGISKRTVERLEDGASTQLFNLIRYLRALEMLDALEGLLPAATANPIDQLERRGRTRRRARPDAHAVAEPDTPWTWGEDR